MSVVVLIISHEGVGQALIKTLKSTFGGELPLTIQNISVKPDADPDEILPIVKEKITKYDEGDGVLILTDLFGSTPFNIAQESQCDEKTCIVTGMNLPMLIRIMNYPTLGLKTLAIKARQGGRQGIISSE